MADGVHKLVESQLAAFSKKQSADDADVSPPAAKRGCFLDGSSWLETNELVDTLGTELRKKRAAYLLSRLDAVTAEAAFFATKQAHDELMERIKKWKTDNLTPSSSREPSPETQEGSMPEIM